ncbi:MULTISPECIES: lmo0937 family membrane protein [Clostridium]|uniref:Lmo0937 family membrane protein n=1 Tax=Clostridium frigoriphilum TaxID=443253 RepID=A0ABU7USH9_9CLOT|nr:lmo0937 family membrane protein [Clostridium sp. DSM 17811]MBU3100913.1 lmo0937 family membrane protein [Clostridium sp. DSM 17811]
MGFLRWIIGVMIILWLLGFVLHIGGGMIHILIVIAVILFVFDFVTGRGKH